MIHSLKKLLKSNYLFTLGILICLGWILAAVLAPVVAPYDPIAQDLSMRLKAPSAIHWFGTDNFGRDIFSRVIYGGRYSLLAGCLSVIIAGIIGTFYGALAGYVGGWLDNVMMRFSEMILSFPSLILAMIINAVMGSNLFNTMFALVIVLAYLRTSDAKRCIKRKGKRICQCSRSPWRFPDAYPDERDHSKQRQLRPDHGYHRHRKQDPDVLHLKLLRTWLRSANTGMGYDGF